MLDTKSLLVKVVEGLTSCIRYVLHPEITFAEGKIILCPWNHC